jgi:hypothetical protein
MALPAALEPIGLALAMQPQEVPFVQSKESEVRNVTDMVGGSDNPKVAAVDHAVGRVLFKYRVPDFDFELHVNLFHRYVATLGARLAAYLMAKQKEAQGLELR